MKKGGYRKVLIGAALLTISSGLWADHPYKVAKGPKDFYFGHVSYIETTPEGTDPVVLRDGQSVPEQAVLNLPVGPGDTIRTSADRRCEIQFDTGTIVRLDFNTQVRVQTILARSLSGLEEISSLALDKGRVYVMYKEYDRREMFQVLTPNVAIKMKHNSVAIIAAAEDGSTEGQVKYGKAWMRFGASAKLLQDREVRKGQRLIIQKDNQFQDASALTETAFDLWNKDINAHFDALHEGLSPLPKPVQKFSPAVLYFAQTFRHYGEWLWDDYYGYIWRPFINNGAYPWGWRPYYYGQWAYVAGQMFWVPQEPWGWIPYHLGIWQWDKKHGWIWLPGSMFASAWTTWDFYFGFACWRPWDLYDWMGGYDAYTYAMYGFYFVNGNWIYSPYWNTGAGMPVLPGLTVVRKDQLKQRAATSYPIPSELKGALKKVTAAYAKGDVRIRESAAEAPRHLVFVAKGDLKARAVNEKAMTWDQVPKSGAPPSGKAAALRRPADPGREAARIFQGIDGPAAVPRTVSAPDPKVVERGSRPAVLDAPSGRTDRPVRRGDADGRFRDWNPDVKIARELGVHIEYSSQRNEVRCPELKLSSRDRERSSGLAPHLTSHGVSYGPSAFVGQGNSVSSGASNPTGASASGKQEGRPSGGAEKRESKGNEGGKIKN